MLQNNLIRALKEVETWSSGIQLCSPAQGGHLREGAALAETGNTRGCFWELKGDRHCTPESSSCKGTCQYSDSLSRSWGREGEGHKAFDFLDDDVPIGYSDSNVSISWIHESGAQEK